MQFINFSPPPETRKQPVYKNALKILAKLKDNGYTAYIAGGFVRDLLIKKPFGHDMDIDIASSASPDIVKKMFRHTIEVGVQFGVIIVLIDRHQYQVASFRKDDDYIDGRRPKSISFAEPEIDAGRRDFTINGLFYDPLEGRIIDYVGGIQDIKKRIIRAIGDPFSRISEDRLRMLRAVRFSAVLGFEMDNDTFQAIIKENEGIKTVSRERICEELKKALLKNPRPSDFMILFDRSGLLGRIIPEILELKDIPSENKSSSLFDKMLYMLDNNTYKDTLELIFAIILLNTGKMSESSSLQAKSVLDRLRFQKKIISQTADLIENRNYLLNARDYNKAGTIRFFMKNNILLHIELLRLQLLADSRDMDPFYDALNAYLRFSREAFPKPLITGRDLISLGIEKGPAFSRILKKIYDLQLEKKIHRREEAMNFVRGKYCLGNTR